MRGVRGVKMSKVKIQLPGGERERERGDAEEQAADAQRRQADDERDHGAPAQTGDSRIRKKSSGVGLRSPASPRAGAPTPTIAHWPSETLPLQPVRTTSEIPTIA